MNSDAFNTASNSHQRATLVPSICTHCNIIQDVPSYRINQSVKCIHCGQQFMATPKADIDEQWRQDQMLEKRREEEAELTRLENLRLEEERIATDKRKQIQDRRAQMATFLHEARDKHYVSINSNMRNTIEDEHAIILKEGVDSWGANECDLHILLTTMKGRAEWLDTQWKYQVLEYLSRNAAGQAAVKANQVHFAKALNEIAEKLGTVKTAATFGGMWAAGELGRQLGGSLGGDG